MGTDATITLWLVILSPDSKPEGLRGTAHEQKPVIARSAATKQSSAWIATSSCGGLAMTNKEGVHWQRREESRKVSAGVHAAGSFAALRMTYWIF
jgi:hypothetical protein